MPTDDAEMPDHKALKEDLQDITAHLSRLRSDIQGLGLAVGATGSHQAEALQAEALEALNEGVAGIEDAVRQDPLKSLAIAAGLGVLLGIALAR